MTYTLRVPKTQENCVIFSSPHSGRDYPAEFIANSCLSLPQLRSSEDAFVDELFWDVVNFGSPQLCATTPRAYVDFNRAADELDASIISDIKSIKNNPRIESGLGVIPRVVSKGQQIQLGKITLNQAKARLKQHYVPFHTKLQHLLDETKNRFGTVVLLDCHSMPSDALNGRITSTGKRPDIVLGDCFGAASAAKIVAALERAFIEQGFIVAKNIPFSGGFITQEYGVPDKSQHVVQIEINRSLYMNENTIEKRADFPHISERLVKACSMI